MVKMLLNIILFIVSLIFVVFLYSFIDVKIQNLNTKFTKLLLVLSKITFILVVLTLFIYFFPGLWNDYIKTERTEDSYIIQYILTAFILLGMWWRYKDLNNKDDKEA